MKTLKVLILVLSFLGVCMGTVSAANAQDSGLRSLRESGKAFRSVAKQVSPAVVFIQVEKDVEQQSFVHPFGGTPFGDEFFRRFFGTPEQQQPQQRTPQKKQRQNRRLAESLLYRRGDLC